MQDYRLYYLDEAGHIRRAVEFTCPGDQEALDHALAQADGRSMELWSRERFVHRFERRTESA